MVDFIGFMGTGVLIQVLIVYKVKYCTILLEILKTQKGWIYEVIILTLQCHLLLREM